MWEAVPSPYLVPDDESFRQEGSPTTPPEGAPDQKRCRHSLKELTARLDDLQRLLYADDRYSLLLVFQAMDAAGKDGTIRAILDGVNPAGCQVFTFKQPSKEELDHDFLWRTARSLPERGRIGVFNRSYYEEVLVVRVHREYLRGQRLPGTWDSPGFWQQRFQSIRDHEKHLALNGTVIVKFWLNVSKEEQRQRFLARLDEPEKNWKFSAGDVREREFWNNYMTAYEESLAATSRSWAPWYAVPADDKPFMRMAVADIVVKTLERLPLKFPVVAAGDRAQFDEMRSRLASGRA